ncbi:PepSY domain-containing protein [uncultured Rhodoblastus sp.]|uniref:PepSY domain-containing protein n=1 Tax=uncultured Rhodoblastus sp. TaxID=543037 RepID=UPI0025E5089E|nr:PepSY domain-containing protein [uncultured Rhodoblastus sp.]
MRKWLILASIAALAGTAGLARAESLGRPCTTKPQADYLSLDALKAKVAEQGYEIRSGEIKKACGEFYVIDKLGKKDELFLDPTTGVIVSGGSASSGGGSVGGKVASSDKDDEDDD